MTANLTTLDALECLTLLEESEAFSGCPPYWDEAMAARPACLLSFLNPQTLVSRREAAGLPADVDASLRNITRIIREDAALTQLAWYIHWRFFLGPECGSIYGFPALEKRLGILSGAFYELLALEFPVRLAAIHQQRGYPTSVTQETIKQLTAFDGNHRGGNGCPGIYASQFSWLGTYFRDPYIRLGRLEFQLHPYGGGVHVWRREGDGAVLALMDDGVKVNSVGLQQAHNDPTEGRVTCYIEEETEVSGNPVDPAGFILPETICLARKDWKQVLQRGITVLDLHIPAGGGMTWEACVDSFQRALAFFPQYHPEQPFVAVVVYTWFMDPRLRDLLPYEANPLRLQRACYLYPSAQDQGGLWFIFLQPTDLPEHLPRNTSLRRVLAEFLENGGVWHSGCMFLLKEDMANPEEGHYLEMFKALREDLNVKEQAVNTECK